MNPSRSVTANSIILCDQATQDEETGQWSLVRIHNQIVVAKFPATRQLCLYINTTVLSGHHAFRLEFIHLEDKKILGEGYGELNVDDPVLHVEFVITPGKVKFSHPGKYAFRLFADDTLVTERIFLVERLPSSRRK